MTQDPDVVDLREIGAALRRGRRWIVGGAAVGLLFALAITLTVEPKFRAASTVLVRSGDQAPSVLAQLGGLAGGLPGAIRSDLDTELQLLMSRALIAGVVDSLGLQARVVDPKQLSHDAVFAAAQFAPTLPPAVYRFERNGNSYQVSGPRTNARARPGDRVRLPGAFVTLRRSGLPDAFAVQFVGMEEAVDAVRKGLVVENPGGDIIRLVFRSHDPRLAAAVPNALVGEYLRRRRTTDRGVNQRRLEFLTEQAESTAGELALAEASLRGQQERSGVVDPEIAGKADLERVMSLRAELEGIEVEARALEQIIAQSTTGEIPARQLAAYPTFLRNAAINSLLSQLLERETRRVELLERRTERDPEVVALTKTIEGLEAQLVALSRSYRNGLLRQQEALSRELGQYRQELASLPRTAQENTRRRRDVARLSETLLALQAQIVEARLGAISEGGEVRLVDQAVIPREPFFPNPTLNLMGGVVGGLFFGVVTAVASAQIRRRVRESWEAELATGLPAVRFDLQLPLSFASINGARSVLLVPLDGAATAVRVGEHMAATAALRGTNVVLANLLHGDNNAGAANPPGDGSATAADGSLAASKALVPVATSNGRGYPIFRGGHDTRTLGVRAALEQLEQRFSLVVAILPGIADPSTVSLLTPDRPAVIVVRSGAARTELREFVSVLARMGVTPVGVVLVTPEKSGKRRS